jgi:hypothetical protein
LPNNITITKPNANVNIEYGQMIGFNKFIIPFQHENFPLPFNVNGLDTIKYNDRNFGLPFLHIAYYLRKK